MSTSPYARQRHHRLELPPGGLRRSLLAIALVVVGAVAGIAGSLLAGVLHTSAGTRTVVDANAPGALQSNTPAGAWRGVYAATVPGSVDITVRSAMTVPTPFGERSGQATARGSGFVLDGRGDILTAAHVVSGERSITIAFQDGTRRKATVLGTDNAIDISVVHVDPSGLALHPLRLGSSKALVVGDALAVIGDPLGFDRSLSTGVVSALDRTIQAPNGFRIAHAIQTDAALNPGNSGGPLFDLTGRVIGIADQIATGSDEFGNATSDTNTGVGFAVPIDVIKAELTALEHGRQVSHAYLGIETGPGTSEQVGAVVSSVDPGTPAARAGLRAGDLIVGAGGARITSEGDLIDALAAAKPGQRMTLTVLRANVSLRIAVTLGAQPTHAPSP